MTWTDADKRLDEIIDQVLHEPPLEEEPPIDQTRYWYMLEAMERERRENRNQWHRQQGGRRGRVRPRLR